MNLKHLYGLLYSDNLENAVLPKNTVLASNGLFTVSNSKYGQVITLLEDIKKLPEPFKSLPRMKEEYIHTQTDRPIIPFAALQATLAFYRDIYDLDKTEAQVNFYWNKDNVTLPNVPGVYDWGNGIVSYTPKQKNSGALTSVEKTDTYYDWFRENLDPFLETHSHHTMAAFASGTDIENSTFDGYQITFGKILNKTPELFAWVTAQNEVLQDLPLESMAQFFEIPINKYETYVNGVLDDTYYEFDLDTTTWSDDYPVDWLDQHSKNIYKAKTPTYSKTSNFSYYDYTQDSLYFDDDELLEDWEYPLIYNDWEEIPKADKDRILERTYSQPTGTKSNKSVTKGSDLIKQQLKKKK